MKSCLEWKAPIHFVWSGVLSKSTHSQKGCPHILNIRKLITGTEMRNLQGRGKQESCRMHLTKLHLENKFQTQQEARWVGRTLSKIIPRVHLHVMRIEEENRGRYKRNIKVLDVRLDFRGISVNQPNRGKLTNISNRFRKLHTGHAITFLIYSLNFTNLPFTKYSHVDCIPQSPNSIFKLKNQNWRCLARAYKIRNQDYQNLCNLSISYSQKYSPSRPQNISTWIPHCNAKQCVHKWVQSIISKE